MEDKVIFFSLVLFLFYCASYFPVWRYKAYELAPLYSVDIVDLSSADGMLWLQKHSIQSLC